MNVPVTRRAILEFWSGVKFSTWVTLNFGETPCTFMSRRLWSPSWAKASLRIASIRSVRFLVLATVKSQAR